MRLHHGTLNAVLLSTVLDFNRDHVGGKYERLNRVMGQDSGADPAQFFRNLNAEIGMPGNLAKMGIARDMIPGLAEHAAKDICTGTNARAASDEDFRGLFEIAIGA